MNSYAFTSSQYGDSPLHNASMNGHVEVMAKLIAGNADINLENEVSTSLHVSERFRLYQGLPMTSAWNTRWCGKVPAIVSQSALPWEKLGFYWTSLNNYQVHTQSKKYRGSALRNLYDKAQGSCALSRRSLAGGAILDKKYDNRTPPRRGVICMHLFPDWHSISLFCLCISTQIVQALSLTSI